MDTSFFTRKIGPMPMWAWLGLSVGGLLAITSWQKNKQAAGEDGRVIQQYELPENIDPQYTFVDADTTLITQQWRPPGGGRPPAAPVQQAPAPALPAARPPARLTVPRLDWSDALRRALAAQATRMQPPAPAPAGSWVPVVAWKSGQAPGTPSTLWGMAESVYGSGKGNMWGRIWDAPQNAQLRSLRGAPEKIQPGDKFWVPK